MLSTEVFPWLFCKLLDGKVKLTISPLELLAPASQTLPPSQLLVNLAIGLTSRLSSELTNPLPFILPTALGLLGGIGLGWWSTRRLRNSTQIQPAGPTGLEAFPHPSQRLSEIGLSDPCLPQVLAAVPGMVYQFQMDAAGQFSFPYVSAFCRQIYGLEPEAVQADASAIVRLTCLDNPEDFFQSIRFSAATLQPWDWMGRIINTRGELKWIQAMSQPERQADGSTLWTGVVIEVSDRSVLATAMTSDPRLEAANENANYLVTTMNLSGQFVYVSPRVQDLLGYSPDEMLDKPFTTLTHPDDQPACQVHLQELIATAKPMPEIEFRAMHSSGQWRWMVTHNSPITDRLGRVVGVKCLTRDIHDCKQLTAALSEQDRQLKQTLQELQQAQFQLIQSEKLSALGQLVAEVAHEINNPVNFIYGNLSYATEYSQNLLRLLQLYQQFYPDPAPEVRSQIEEIDLTFLMEDLPNLMASMRIGAERIRAIVNSLRSFSRMDEFDRRAIDIHEGINNTLMILQHRLKAKNDRPEIRVVLDYGQLPLVECYAGQLNQVFMNILSNAIDAVESWQTEQAQSNSLSASVWGVIRIKTVRKSNWIEIEIADNGMGMNELTHQRLFDPFFTTKPVGKGTGIGLSLSHQIITERHGGKLTCRSEPGQGATFTIELPISAASSSEPIT